MGLVEEHKRESVEISAHFMEGLVGDYGDAAVACEMRLDFCWSFRLLYCEHEGVRRVMIDKLVD
jgi:hypothetical protein